MALLLICGYNTYPTAATKSAIPSSCYSPSGTSCNWYRECLEKKHPCDSSSYPYALTFAEHFCKVYGKHYSWFTRDGQRWVDGVRKCLQVCILCASQFQPRASPSRVNPRSYPRPLKKLFKCPALRAIFVGKCPAPRSYYDGQMPGPPVHPINIQNY